MFTGLGNMTLVLASKRAHRQLWKHPGPGHSGVLFCFNQKEPSGTTLLDPAVTNWGAT